VVDWLVLRAPVVRVLAAACAAGTLAAGCGDQPAAPKAVVGNVTLAPGEYTLVTGNRAAGPLRFPAAGLDGAEYLVVGQLATGTADVNADFSLAGGLPVAAIVQRTASARPELPVAIRFHDTIRRLDEAAARASLRLGAAGALAAPSVKVGPPVVGSQRTFKVCADLDCSATTGVTATAVVVGAHSAIYLDRAAPVLGGFTSVDLEQLAAQFDTILYPVDTVAFGAPSDIDGNGVVIILLTPQVNALVGRPDCQTSFITGFFLANDLAPATRASYNDGEVFYAMVPDPTGQVSCPHAVGQVMSLIAPTFIHEFQHMISFNQHVLVRRGPIEVLWLNEAMSHLAEELGGRHYDSLGLGTTGAGFLFGNLYNAYLYLVNPAVFAVITTSGTDDLEQRGGQWLFLRYLVDRLGAGATQRLEQTSLTGEANVVAAAGKVPLATLLGRWALALFVSDLPSFSADTALQYVHWQFRATYDSLRKEHGNPFLLSFPLQPAAVRGPFAVSGTVSSGSGSYVDIVQNAVDPEFTVTFTEPGGLALRSSARPQLAIVRLR
jgi:hypothetical protein